LDYEQFYTDAQGLLKELKEKTDSQSKNVKKIQKCIADGDVAPLPKLFAALRDAAQKREDALECLQTLAENFDGQQYMSSGDFAAQMLECCSQFGVDVQGSFPVYEMFPYRVIINPEAQDVTVDRKHIQCLRPSKLVSDIKTQLDKLSDVSFNAQLFLKELAAAYDTAIIKAARKKRCPDDAPIYALDLYEVLTPMKRYKKDYTKHNFAYDLARLYAEEGITVDNERILRFDTARDMKKAIRILDRNGAEQFITTIRFVRIKQEG